MTIQILLADDHAIMREGLRYLLNTQSDLRVISEAANGRQAVEQASLHKPDVVIMDIAMPELNGIEAAAQIRAAAPGTQVVILSMHATREHVYRAFSAGVMAYLLKDSAGQELVEAVRAVHLGQRYVSKRIADLVLNGFMDLRAHSMEKDRLEDLSGREREVLQLVVEGKSSAEIAQTLYLSPKTIETYRSRIMEKLGIKDLPGLVKFAIQHGLISLEQ